MQIYDIFFFGGGDSKQRFTESNVHLNLLAINCDGHSRVDCVEGLAVFMDWFYSRIGCIQGLVFGIYSRISCIHGIACIHKEWLYSTIILF